MEQITVAALVLVVLAAKALAILTLAYVGARLAIRHQRRAIKLTHTLKSVTPDPQLLRSLPQIFAWIFAWIFASDLCLDLCLDLA